MSVITTKEEAREEVKILYNRYRNIDQVKYSYSHDKEPGAHEIVYRYFSNLMDSADAIYKRAPEDNEVEAYLKEQLMKLLDYLDAAVMGKEVTA